MGVVCIKEAELTCQFLIYSCLTLTEMEMDWEVKAPAMEMGNVVTLNDSGTFRVFSKEAQF